MRLAREVSHTNHYAWIGVDASGGREVGGSMIARLALLLVGLTILAGCVGEILYTGGSQNYCQRTTSESSAYNDCVAREIEHADRRRSRSYSP